MKEFWRNLWIPKSKRPKPKKACTINRDCILWDGHNGGCLQ